MQIDKTEAITPSAAGASPEQRIDRLAAYVEQLSADLHALKGNLAANTAITQDVATGQDAVKALLAKINVEKIIELVDAVDSMRGGIKVLGGWSARRSGSRPSARRSRSCTPSGATNENRSY